MEVGFIDDESFWKMQILRHISMLMEVRFTCQCSRVAQFDVTLERLKGYSRKAFGAACDCLWWSGSGSEKRKQFVRNGSSTTRVIVREHHAWDCLWWSEKWSSSWEAAAARVSEACCWLSWRVTAFSTCLLHFLCRVASFFPFRSVVLWSYFNFQWSLYPAQAQGQMWRRRTPMQLSFPLTSLTWE